MARYDYTHISREIRDEFSESLKSEISSIDLTSIIKDALKRIRIDIEDIDFTDVNFKLAIEKGLYYALNGVKREIKVDMGQIDIADFLTLNQGELNRKIYDLHKEMKQAFADANKELGKNLQDQFFAAMTVATARGVKLNPNYSVEWDKSYQESFSNAATAAEESRMRKLQIEIQSQVEDYKQTRILAEKAIQGIKEDKPYASQNEVLDILKGLLPKVTKKTNEASDAQDELQEQIHETNEQLDSLSTKSLEELVELYHQLGVSGGTKQSLEEISNAILDIIEAEKHLDASEMERFVEILRGLTFSEGDSPILKTPFSVEEAMNALNELQKTQQQLESVQKTNERLEETLDIERDFSDRVSGVNDDLRETLELREQERNTLSNDLEEEKAKTAELQKQNELLREQKEEAELDATHAWNSANSHAVKGWELEDELNQANAKIEELEEDLRKVENASDNVSSSGLFDSSNTTALVNSLEKISSLLEDIRNTLGTIDDNNGFKNLITSIDELMTKLQAIQEKVGTGVYNIAVTQGTSKEAVAATQSTDAYIKSREASYRSAYEKVVARAGDEEKLFAAINNAVGLVGGISELQSAFSALSVTQIQSAEERIQRYIRFFDLLRQAMSKQALQGFSRDENNKITQAEWVKAFDIDLSGIRIPSGNDSAFRAGLKKRSVSSKTESEIPQLEDDTQMLKEIVSKLEDIRNILNDIANNNALGEVFGNAAVNLNEFTDALANLKEILNGLNVNIENPVQQAFTDEFEKDLDLQKQKTAEIQEQNNLIQAQNELLREQSQISTANEEDNVLTRLREKLDSVIEGINLKNQAFIEEGQIVDETVQKEVNALESLRELLRNINNASDVSGSEGERTAFSGVESVIKDIQDTLGIKNDLLAEEFELVAKEVPNEIALFESLSKILDTVAERISKIMDNVQTLSKSKVFTDAEKEARKAEDAARKQQVKEETAAKKQQEKAAAKAEAQRQKEAEKIAKALEREEQAEIEKDSRKVVQYYNRLEKNEQRYQQLVAKQNAGINLTSNEESTLRTLQNQRDEEENILRLVKERTDEIEQARKGYEQIKLLERQNANVYARDSLRDNITKRINDVQTKINSKKYTTFSSTLAQQRLNNIKQNDYMSNDNIDNLKSYVDLVNQVDKNLVKVGNNTKLVKMLSDVNTAIAHNSKMSGEMRSNFEALGSTIQRAIDTGASQEEVQALTQRFLNLKNEMIATGQEGRSFADTIKNDIGQASARMIAQYMSFQDWIRYIRNAVSAVTELDSALNQLKIISNATDAALQGVANNAYTLANNLGMTTTEVVSSITEWKRLGYSMEDSMVLAEQAARLSTGGMMDISEATTSLISSMQAFELGADEVGKVVDQYIYLGKFMPMTNYIG